MSLLSLLLRPRSFEERLDVVVVEYLVVAGGGGGGVWGETLGGNARTGGGGGAGGVLQGSTAIRRGRPVTVYVGTGGSAAQNGLASAIDEILSIGGGAGGSGGSGSSGGSGGGAGGTQFNSSAPGGLGTPGQGNDGEQSNGPYGGGGGGAGAVGSLFGGSGISSSITGSPVVYGRGGGGGNSIDDLPDLSPTGNGGNGSAANEITTCILVAGAGSDEYNGIYCPSGSYGVYAFGPAPAWRLGDTDKYIYLKDGLTWSIGTLQPYEAYFLNNLTLDENGIPIYSGPSFDVVTAVNGDEPVPVVGFSTFIVGYAPQAGSPGVVVIAYPDTLPEITVSGGLTYDQPTRSGYRVYRFTAGSGTITFP